MQNNCCLDDISMRRGYRVGRSLRKMAQRLFSVRALMVFCGLTLLVGCVLNGNRSVLAQNGCDGWFGAEWIADGKPMPGNDAAFYENDPAPLFRKIFTVEKKIKRAWLNIAGLGLYQAHLNGRPVADGAPAPLWTPYGKRVLYDRYDVTGMLESGVNALAVELGNGWYNALPMKMWGRYNLRDVMTVGRPCLIARLEITYADGTTEKYSSDASWKVAEGPLLRNSIYLGEVYDARKEKPDWRLADYADAGWRTAVRVDGPGGVLEPRRAPAVVRRRVWTAQSVSEPSTGVFVADMGRNFAGVAAFRLGSGTAGQRITFRYGELLNKDGSVNVMTTVSGQIKREGMAGPGAPARAEQQDVYIRSGGGDEMYMPRFTWHGFRYVQIEGLAQAPEAADIKAYELASDLQDACEFECSLPMFNQIHRVCRDTFLANVMGVQSDCPARERFGYGADIAVTTEAFIFNFDMNDFYAKTIQDYADEAEDDGWFTETAPFVGVASQGFGGRSGPIGWTVGVPIMMRDLYRYYGNVEVIARHYDGCARYVDLVKEKTPGLVIDKCIGDHEALDKAPEALTATAHFYQWAKLVAEFAAIIGKNGDADKYNALADDIRTAFRKRFIVGGRVGKGGQGEQLFGLYHRLIPEADRAAALEILRKDIEDRGKALSTGIYSTKYLLQVLSAEGMEELAGKLVARREFPSWGYMLDNGATTLWETWKPSDNVYSQNHPMFGSVEEWFMKYVLGIAVADDAVGFDKVVIRPRAVAGMTWAHGSYRSVKGDIKVSWTKKGERMRLNVELPLGVTARVWPEGHAGWIEVGPGKHVW